MVIPTFVKQALFGHSITIHGDGKQSRSFTFVGDVVKALINLANDARAVGQVFNIGSNQETTIEDLAKLVKEMTNSASEIIYIPYAEAYEDGFEDMPRRLPDLGKIRNLLGYAPTLDLPAILRTVIDYHLQKMEQHEEVDDREKLAESLLQR